MTTRGGVWSTTSCTVWTAAIDRKSTRLNSSHLGIAYAVSCLKKKNTHKATPGAGQRTERAAPCAQPIDQPRLRSPRLTTPLRPGRRLQVAPTQPQPHRPPDHD